MKNPFEDQRVVASAAVASLAAAILLGNASGTAAPSFDGRLTLPSRLATPAAINVRANPFIAFTVPHTGTVVNGTQVVNSAPLMPSGNQIINAPGRPGYVPSPGGVAGPQSAPDVVLLCDTWTAKPGSSQTPTAVFLIGKTSVIATAGDLVGGYRVAKIGDGVVHFDTGESLALGDCQSIDSTTNGTDNGDDADGNQAAPAPTNTPPVMTDGRLLPNGRGVPIPAGANIVPTIRATSSPTTAPYGPGADEDYGSTIYGKPAPTSAPYPIAIPNGR